MNEKFYKLHFFIIFLSLIAIVYSTVSLAEYGDDPDRYYSKHDDVGSSQYSKLNSDYTLARTFEFTTQEEEYHFELNRNDTHKMLINLMLEENATNTYDVNLVSQYLRKASGLREYADKKAGQYELEAAIQILELSTIQFIRAIHATDYYIPN